MASELTTYVVTGLVAGLGFFVQQTRSLLEARMIKVESAIDNTASKDFVAVQIDNIRHIAELDQERLTRVEAKLDKLMELLLYGVKDGTKT